jgi:DNA-binding Lrp family transcriptional regulator
MSRRGKELIIVGSLDRLDAALLGLLEEDPRRGIVELAERLGTTRNTVHARLARLQASGRVRGFGLQLDLEGIGLPVLAFVSIGLAQGSLDDAVEALAAMPHVLEAHTTTGDADLVVRIAAESHSRLQLLIQELLAVPGVVRTTTVVALTTPVAYRVRPLLDHLTEGTGRGRARTAD